MTKTPGPTVTIMEPKDGSSYKATASVPLSGAATDKYDGNITSPQQMRWSRDFTDPAGEGTMDHLDPNTFMPGMHTITLVVVDSKCLVGTETVNIDVTQ